MSPWAIVWRYLRDPTFRRMSDRRTDGQTDRQTHDDSIYRASIASRVKKTNVCVLCSLCTATVLSGTARNLASL